MPRAPSRPGGWQARALAAWAAFAQARPALAAAVPGVALIVVGLLGFAVMLDSVREQDDVTVLDEPVLRWLVGIRGPIGTAVLAGITLVSGPVVLPVLVTGAALGWGLRTRRWWRPFLLLCSMATATLLSLAVKRGVARPRPPLDDQYIPGAETTFSFPSGHTIGTATLCLVGGYLVWSRRPTRRGLVLWWTTTALATGAVGLSRLYLGYHFVTDVLAAAALAVAVLGAVVVVDQRRLLRSTTRGTTARPRPADAATPGPDPPGQP